MYAFLDDKPAREQQQQPSQQATTEIKRNMYAGYMMIDTQLYSKRAYFDSFEYPLKSMLKWWSATSSFRQSAAHIFQNEVNLILSRNLRQHINIIQFFFNNSDRSIYFV